MTDRPQATTDNAGDWLDVLLRKDALEHRADHVEDAGFSARVMAALPAPAAAPAWRKPVLAVLWAATGVGIAFALPGVVTDATHEILRVILGQRLSLSGIVAGVAVLGAATWAAAAYALRED